MTSKKMDVLTQTIADTDNTEMPLNVEETAPSSFSVDSYEETELPPELIGYDPFF